MKKKMPFRIKTFLLTTLINWPFYLWIAFLMYKLNFLFFMKNMSGGMVFFMYVLLGLLFDIFVMILLHVFSPIVKLQNQLETEYETNGYSDRYIELCNQMIHYPGTNYYSNIAEKYIMQLANAYMLKNDYQAALDMINKLDPAKMKELAERSSVNTLYLLQYFDVQMCVCEDKKDVRRARAVFEDALPYLEKKKRKVLSATLIVKEIYMRYYLLMQEFDKAKSYVDDIMKRAKNADIRFIGNLMYAIIYTRMHNFGEAERYLALCEAENETAVGRDYIENSRREIIKEKSSQ